MSEIEEIDGFKVFEGDTLIIDDKRIQGCMEFFEKKNLKKIWISRFHGYLHHDIEFLKSYSFLKQVILNGPFDITGLYYLSNLEYLSYNNLDKSSVLDLKHFKKILTIYVDLKSTVINLDSLVIVKVIRLFNYSCKEKNFRHISNLKNLESLYISISDIESLTGIENLIKLKNIEFHYLKNLTNIAQLKYLHNTLESLIIGNAKKIEDFDSVKELKKLETLGFSKCGSIPSISFLKDMPKLSDFRFVDTAIEDGNLYPLVRLKFAGFMNKRYYSHTYEELALLHGHS